MIHGALPPEAHTGEDVVYATQYVISETRNIFTAFTALTAVITIIFFHTM